MTPVERMKKEYLRRQRRGSARTIGGMTFFVKRVPGDQWGVAYSHLIEACAAFQERALSNPASISEAASLFFDRVPGLERALPAIRDRVTLGELSAVATEIFGIPINFQGTVSDGT